MIQKNIYKLIFTLIVVALVLVSCNLPTVTPPAEYNPSTAPTITAPVPATVSPTPPPAAVEPEVIAVANAAQLQKVNTIAVSNVLLFRWSIDSSVLGLSQQNEDANGNYVSSATFLDGRTLATKTTYTPADGRVSDISPDGRLVAAISSDLTSMSIYDLGDGNKDIVAISPGYLINNVTFSPDGKSFAISSNDTWMVSIHSLPGGEEVKILSGFETAAPVYDAGFRGNNDAIVWHARATLQTQNVASGTMGGTTSSEDFLSAYQLSPDGKTLAGATLKTIDGKYPAVVTLWDAATGSEVKNLVFSENAGITSLDFSPDGSLLAVTTGNDVQVWDVANGSALVTLTGHAAVTSLVAFSPDGKSLVSTGQDNQLILWQVIP